MERYKDFFFKFVIIYYWLLNYFIGGSDNEIERFSPMYFMFTLPIVLYIVVNSQYIFTRGYNKKNLPLVFLVLFTSVVSVLRFDLSTFISVNLLLLTIVVIINSKVTIPFSFINKLFLFSVFGSIISYHLGVNEYGYFPKFGSVDLMIYGDVGWRISLFPLLPESAMFSLIVIINNFFYNKNKISRLFYFLLAGYFLVFGGLRTSIILFAFFVLFILCTRFFKFGYRAFYINFNSTLIVLFILALSFQTIILYFNQFDNEFVNQLLFKSSQGISSKEQLYNTISRVWIWEKHIDIFMTNPLFGVGTYEFQDYVIDSNLAYQKTTGSESFFTNLLARIGVSAFLLFSFLYKAQRAALLDKNKLVYFLVLILSVIVISYGSFFVPYNFLFLLYIGLLNIKLK
ncbi:hypothetical protein ATO12_22860 [Aquimarina atlantica]|uniref:O-antigen ligase-related domain-containing protein n=1 Tax=Aquimarina atlantica TaxID=1317122 RepID=A0A023BQM3_9FLAO|nr:O-antigen ligase family protein [Aquimarina atlantica]EZH72296.1 hypothetical protein ATO12_22860 [Aquimarina atlantica]